MTLTPPEPTAAHHLRAGSLDGLAAEPRNQPCRHLGGKLLVPGDHPRIADVAVDRVQRLHHGDDRARLGAKACSSPWLITPSAAPPIPSTVTSSLTRRRLPVPSSSGRASSTFDCCRSSSQIRCASSAMGSNRWLRRSEEVCFIHFSAALRAGTDSIPR